MKMLLKLTREAARYKGLYVLAICSTLGLTLVNLTAPKVLSSMTGIVERGVDDAAREAIAALAALLLVLYLLRILLRFLTGFFFLITDVDSDLILDLLFNDAHQFRFRIFAGHVGDLFENRHLAVDPCLQIFFHLI